MSCTHPKVRKKLLEMLQEDQTRIKSGKGDSKSQYYKRADHAHHLVKGLSIVGKPTIGIDGATALSVISLHAEAHHMKAALDLLSKAYEVDKSFVNVESIAALHDRLCLIKKHPQRYGTQWLLSSNGLSYLYKIEDFNLANKLRAQMGIGPIRRPRNVATGEYPLGNGLAVESDQNY